MRCIWQPAEGSPVYAPCPDCGHAALLHKRGVEPTASTCDLCEFRAMAERLQAAAAEVFRILDRIPPQEGPDDR